MDETVLWIIVIVGIVVVGWYLLSIKRDSFRSPQQPRCHCAGPGTCVCDYGCPGGCRRSHKASECCDYQDCVNLCLTRNVSPPNQAIKECEGQCSG